MQACCTQDERARRCAKGKGCKAQRRGTHRSVQLRRALVPRLHGVQRRLGSTRHCLHQRVLEDLHAVDQAMLDVREPRAGVDQRRAPVRRLDALERLARRDVAGEVLVRHDLLAQIDRGLRNTRGCSLRVTLLAGCR